MKAYRVRPRFGFVAERQTSYKTVAEGALMRAESAPREVSLILIPIINFFSFTYGTFSHYN